MAFHLAEQDWIDAEGALTGKPSGTKHAKHARDLITNKKIRTSKRTAHSFIIIEDVIYALADTVEDPTEEGGSSVVKKGMTKEGKIVAIKIKSSDLENIYSDAIQASIKNKLFIGQGVRKESGMRIKFKRARKIIQTDKKLYTVMEWRGDSLISQIESRDFTYTDTQKRVLGLRACLLLEKLQLSGMVHGDLKAENLTASISGNHISVNIVDLEYAKLLTEGETFFTYVTSRGSLGFASPEVLKLRRYSFLSDSYALAIMLLFQIDITCKSINFKYCDDYMTASLEELKKGLFLDPMTWLALKLYKSPLDEKLYKIMSQILAFDYTKRSNTHPLILYLCEKLLADQTLEDDIQQEIRQIQERYSQSPQEMLTKHVLPVVTSTEQAAAESTASAALKPSINLRYSANTSPIVCQPKKKPKLTQDEDQKSRLKP